MGGNVFKDMKTVRLGKEEYGILLEQIKQKLYPVLEPSEMAVPAVVGDKLTFGDLDLLVVADKRQEVDAVMEELSLSSKKNGPVTSYCVDTPAGFFQIDMVYQNRAHFDYSVAYFSYNDLGNLVGRFAHRLGLKHGHDGLWYVINDDAGMNVGKILLTTDYELSSNFLGFDYFERDGVESFDFMFEKVAKHPMFNPDMFLLEERNHTARVRDRKRPTYTAFLEFIKKHEHRLGAAPRLSKREKDAFIFETFPFAQEEVEKVLNSIKLKREARLILGGDAILSLYPSLDGKLISRVLTEIRQMHETLDNDQYHAMIISSGKSSFDDLIRAKVEEFKNERT